MAALKALICVVLLLGVIGFASPHISAGRIAPVVAPAVHCASTAEPSTVPTVTGGCSGSAPATTEEKGLLPSRGIFLPPRLPSSRENLLKVPTGSTP
ncbi:hypothetical protein VPH35_107904 [Triticum aestivum]